MRLVRKLGGAGGTLVLAALAALAITTAVGWFRVTPVLSGSMRGAFNPGDALLMEKVSATSLHVGDVVAIRIPSLASGQRVHRILTLSQDGPDVLVRTKGDANSMADPGQFRLHGDQYVMRARLPYVGWIVNFKAADGMRWLLDAVAVLAAASVAQQIWLYRHLYGERRRRASTPITSLAS